MCPKFVQALCALRLDLADTHHTRKQNCQRRYSPIQSREVHHRREDQAAPVPTMESIDGDLVSRGTFADVRL